MPEEEKSFLSLSLLVTAAARNLTKGYKVYRLVVACLLLYICLLCLFRAPGGGGKRGQGRGKGKIQVKSEKESMLVAELGRRRKLVKETCSKQGAYTTREKFLAQLSGGGQEQMEQGVETDAQLWGLLKKTSNHQFFVQQEHGLMWCKVPKAASTSWLHAFLELAGVPIHEVPEDNGMGLHAFLRDKYPLLSRNLNKQLMPRSIKFVVVRHPFERVVSAYVDKLHSYERDLRYRGGYYYAIYGADIVARLRPKYQQKFPKNPLFMKKEPSFVEFVEYLIETPVTKYDEHWRPQFLLCPPCHFKFDVIVKMETFDRDTQFILSQQGLGNRVSLSRKHSSLEPKTREQDGEPSSSLEPRAREPSSLEPRERGKMQSLFSQLSKPMVRALYHKYRLDFAMFDYSLQGFIEHASDSEGMMPDVMEMEEEAVMEQEEEEEEKEGDGTTEESDSTLSA